MKQHCTVACIVVLIDPPVQYIARKMLLKCSARAFSFHDNNRNNKEGANSNDNYDFLGSCRAILFMLLARYREYKYSYA